jgi:hypothetical protein
MMHFNRNISRRRNFGVGGCLSFSVDLSLDWIFCHFLVQSWWQRLRKNPGLLEFCGNMLITTPLFYNVVTTNSVKMDVKQVSIFSCRL